MSIRVMTSVWDHFPGAGGELLAMLALADWANDEGLCYPSISTAAARMRLSESQARRIIHRLIDDGWLEVVANEAGGAPKASRRYLLNLGRLTPGARARGSAHARGRTAARDPLHGCAQTGVTAVTPEPSLILHEPSGRTGPAAQPPVDKSNDKATPGAELRLIADSLALTKGQLGKVLEECKERGCRLQDVYSSARDALQKNELRGGRAVAYILACLAENPGRDWTAKARRDSQKAELQAEQAADAAQVATARALLEAAGFAGVQVASPRSGKPVLLRPDPHGWSSGLVELLDPRGHRIGSAPLRDFVPALASTAPLEGRVAQ